MSITLTITADNGLDLQQAIREILGIANTNTLLPLPEEGSIQSPVEETPKPRKTRTVKEEKAPEPPKIDDGLEDDETFTVEQIRALGKDIAKVVGPDKVRGLIKEMGFENITAITPDKYAEFATKVKLLK